MPARSLGPGHPRPRRLENETEAFRLDMASCVEGVLSEPMTEVVPQCGVDTVEMSGIPPSGRDTSSYRCVGILRLAQGDLR